jgi:hypothetical protein
MENKIAKGSVIKLKERYAVGEFRGYYRITSIRGQYANLGGVFGKTIYHKRVPLEWLVECQDEWYEHVCYVQMLEPKRKLFKKKVTKR